MRTPRPSQIVFVLSALAGAVVLMVHSYADEYTAMGVGAAVNPVFYPRILLWFWLLLTVVIGVELVVRRANNDAERPKDQKLLLALGTVAVAFVAVVALNTVGYVIVAVPLAAAIVWLFGERHYARLAGVSVVCGFASWWLFDRLLGIPLPHSPFDLPF